MTAYEMRISDWSSDVCSSDRAAYNDAAGVTAAFTLNLLTRINRELDGDFDLAQFAHRAQYNAMAGRIETAIISRRAQAVCVAGTHYHFAAGEAMAVEISSNYRLDRFERLDRKSTRLNSSH